METMTLLCVFLTAIAVSAAIVYAFSVPMDGVIGRVVDSQLASAWSKYAKFALFAASLAGGLRIRDLEALTSGPVDSRRALLEVFKTTLGSVNSSSWTLLAIFGAALAVYAAEQVYGHIRQSRSGRPDHERQHVAAGRY